MKKIAIVLTVIVMLFGTSSLAVGAHNVPTAVLARFERDFSSSKAVTWKKIDDFYFSYFQLGSIDVKAAYTDEGNLLGTSRRIDISLLPQTILTALSGKYKDYYLPAQVIELTFEGQTSYYMTVQNSRQMLDLKVFIDGDIEIEKRIKFRQS